VGDLVIECQQACSFPPSPPVIYGLLAKCGPEIEKLRKEVKALKAANASLATRNYLLALMFVGAVCGSFMAAFLMQ
jgi:hypothetical protein